MAAVDGSVSFKFEFVYDANRNLLIYRVENNGEVDDWHECFYFNQSMAHPK